MAAPTVCSQGTSFCKWRESNFPKEGREGGKTLRGREEDQTKQPKRRAVGVRRVTHGVLSKIRASIPLKEKTKKKGKGGGGNLKMRHELWTRPHRHTKIWFCPRSRGTRRKNLTPGKKRRKRGGELRGGGKARKKINAQRNPRNNASFLRRKTRYSSQKGKRQNTKKKNQKKIKIQSKTTRT